MFGEPEGMVMGEPQKKQIDHEFAQRYPDTFSPTQTVEIQPQTLTMDGQCPNLGNWKKLLPTGLTQGVIYEDDSLSISCNI